MYKYRTGLVVGKFCPLHKGHEFLIKSALEQCQTVVVISYTSTHYKKCSAVNRELWLSKMDCDQKRLRIHVVPDNRYKPLDDAPDVTHRKFCYNILKDDLETTVQVVFSSELYGEGLAEFIRYNQVKDLHYTGIVASVLVDLRREQFPVSGTLVRSSPEYLHYLNPLVRSFFITKVLFLGGESTGKSTITKRLAEHYNVSFVPEFGREWYEYRNKELFYEDMEYIAEHHRLLELDIAALSEKEVLFCDTSAITTAFYSDTWYGRASDRLHQLVMSNITDYDIIYICKADFPMLQDGTRQNENFRIAGQTWALDFLDRYRAPYTILSGSLEEKIKQVIHDIDTVVNS